MKTIIACILGIIIISAVLLLIEWYITAFVFASLCFLVLIALRVEIGSASGQNWWCVMFPPLCFVDVSSGVVPEESKEVLQENLSYEEYNLLSENQNNSDMNFKFKIVELFQNIGIKLAQS